MTDASKTYNDLLLGNALNVILAEEQKALPKISEYQFQREVLDILSAPFTPEAQQRYAVYVGELTKPLQVVSNDAEQRVLFTVPPLVLSPRTSLPAIDSITADIYNQVLRRDKEMGMRGLDAKLADFMLNITTVPDYIQHVVAPILIILKQYGRELHLPNGEVLNAQGGETQVPAGTSSFSDEYDD